MGGPKVCKSKPQTKGQAVNQNATPSHKWAYQTASGKVRNDTWNCFVYLLSPHPFPGTSFLSPGTVVGCSHKVTTIYTCHISGKCWIMLCNCIWQLPNTFQEKSIVPATTLSMIVIAMIWASHHSHHTEECSALFHLCDFVWGSPSKDRWHKSVSIEKWKDFHVLWQFLYE